MALGTNANCNNNLCLGGNHLGLGPSAYTGQMITFSPSHVGHQVKYETG